MATTHLQFSGIDANAKYRPLLGKMELSNAKIDYILCEQLYDYIHEIVAFSIIDCNVVDVKNFNKVLSNMKQLKSLSIWCVNEDEEDEEDFSASFKLSSFSETIKHLNINQLNFDEESSISIENCEALCDILEFNKNIRYLEISGALDKSVVPRLFEVLKTNIHFLDISLGSSFELQTQILLANHRKYLSNEQSEIFEIKIEEFQRATMVFQNTLKDLEIID